MALHDLTADMLTRIRNAVRNREKTVTCLSNKLNRGVVKVLKDEGFVRDFEFVEDGRQGLIRVHLKYGQRGEQLINKIERVSKVGCRIYRGVDELPRPLQGLGISIVSTSRGVMSDRQCREANIGGEVVAEVC
ncbi:MAG: 30S ribosomal protein S8 [Phycisphaerae bacterium]|jgi:small subunit ribosomal protein S8|nr:30S ribosomal protein S8 [Phycisphaerae bacterium]